MRPVDGVTLDEAAHIVGCSRSTLVRHILAGRLPGAGKHERRRVSRADAEALALTVRSSLVHLPAESSYWVATAEAAEILGVNRARVRQLVERGFLPAERHASGGWLFRREQLLTVANARDARWH